MDLTDPLIAQALAVGIVSVVCPLVFALIRKWKPAFSQAEAWKKLATAMASTFAVAAAVTPGDWKARCVAGALAVLLSQGGYNIVRGARNGG